MVIRDYYSIGKTTVGYRIQKIVEMCNLAKRYAFCVFIYLLICHNATHFDCYTIHGL